MIEVAMGQDDRVEPSSVERCFSAVLFTLSPPALKQSAVDQQARIFGGHVIGGAGHVAGRAMEMNSQWIASERCWIRKEIEKSIEPAQLSASSSRA
jgi:hypothetical protein